MAEETAAERKIRRDNIRNSIPRSTAMQAKKTQNAIRAAIPRPPVNKADVDAIVGGQNAAAIRKRRKAINKGATERIKHGGRG